MTIVLVEGESDRGAVLVVAERLGYDVASARVDVVAIGGITNLPRVLADLSGDATRVCLLYDAAQRGYVERILKQHDAERIAAFACERDLEEEFIRVLGTDRVLEILTEHGYADQFRTFQHQPAKRGQSIGDQLHRFLGGRKVRMGALMAREIDLERMPPPLRSLINVAFGGRVEAPKLERTPLNPKLTPDDARCNT